MPGIPGHLRGPMVLQRPAVGRKGCKNLFSLVFIMGLDQHGVLPDGYKRRQALGTDPSDRGPDQGIFLNNEVCLEDTLVGYWGGEFDELVFHKVG